MVPSCVRERAMLLIDFGTLLDFAVGRCVAFLSLLATLEFQCLHIDHRKKCAKKIKNRKNFFPKDFVIFRFRYSILVFFLFIGNVRGKEENLTKSTTKSRYGEKQSSHNENQLFSWINGFNTTEGVRGKRQTTKILRISPRRVKIRLKSLKFPSFFWDFSTFSHQRIRFRHVGTCTHRRRKDDMRVLWWYNWNHIDEAIDIHLWLYCSFTGSIVALGLK